jgi:hypothetical protein
MARQSGRKVADRAEASRMLTEWAQSGERLSDWCRARGVNGYSLNAYQGRGAHAHTAFVELAVGPVPVLEAVAEARYRICLGDDIGIEVDDHFRDDTLRRLIGVVASC